MLYSHYPSSVCPTDKIQHGELQGLVRANSKTNMEINKIDFPLKTAHPFKFPLFS